MRSSEEGPLPFPLPPAARRGDTVDGETGAVGSSRHAARRRAPAKSGAKRIERRGMMAVVCDEGDGPERPARWADSARPAVAAQEAKARTSHSGASTMDYLLH